MTMKQPPKRELSMWACRCGTNVVIETPSKAWMALFTFSRASAPTLDLLFGQPDVVTPPPIVGALEIQAMPCPCCRAAMTRVEPAAVLESIEAGRAAFEAGEPLPLLEPT